MSTHSWFYFSQEVQYLCTKIIEICDYIIFSKDSLVLLPAATDVITLRKRHEQDLVHKLIILCSFFLVC